MSSKKKVIVIGGGIIGTSIACHLAQAGNAVVLLEKEKMLGLGCTQYCSGGLRSQFTTEINVKFSIEAMKDLNRLAKIIDYHKLGYLILDTAKSCQPLVEMQNRLGVPSELLTAEEVKARFPYVNAEGVKSATFYKEDGVADPAALVNYYFKEAKAAGAEFRFESLVKNLIQKDGKVVGVRLENSNEELIADYVVLAAGIGSVQLAETIGVKIPIVKRRKYIFLVDGLGCDHPLIIEVPTGWYIKKEGSDSLIGMSGKEEKVDFEKQEESQEETFAATFHRIPKSESFNLKKVLTSMSDETPDKHAIIEQFIPGFIIATGFSGHGFMHSPVVGKVVASLVSGEKPIVDVAPLALKRQLIKEVIAI
jgi:sarcosine oxidase subunit beta